MARSKSKTEHIDAILREWPYDPNAISVRLVRAGGNREVVQMRVELGVLQLETEGRPDGQRPFDCDSVLEYLEEIQLREGSEYTLNEAECNEADREFVQFYHRRICWLALREFDRAVEDADHTLALMDVCREFSPDDAWTITHEQYRPFVLFHRTQAAALAALDHDTAEAAVEAINDGLQRIYHIYQSMEHEDRFDDDELVARLTEFRETLREQFEVGRTLKEQLADAVAAEHYELAAQLRDQIARNDISAPGPPPSAKR